MEITSPSDLLPKDIYRQAAFLASKTSRASNADWYLEATQLKSQWHIWYDGGREVVSAIYSRDANTWKPGPVLSIAALSAAGEIEAELRGLLASGQFGYKPKSIGVIFHVADEFGVVDITPENQNPEEFEAVRRGLVEEPVAYLSDKKVNPENTAWRLLPFQDALENQQKAVAVAVSRERDKLKTLLEKFSVEHNFPLQLTVTSAPLEALAALNLILPETDRRGRLIVAVYARFTVLYALKPNGHLVQARSVNHRANSQIPPNLGDLIANTAMAVDMPDAMVFIVGASDTPSAPLLTELDNYSKTRLPIRYQWVDSRAIPEVEGMPGKRIEFLVHDVTRFDAIKKASGIPANELSQLSWFLQDFADTGDAEASIYPTQSDMRLVQLSSLLSRVMGFGLVALLFYSLYTGYTIMKSDAWQLPPNEDHASVARMRTLLGEDQAMKFTNGLVYPRSRAWLVMDMLMNTFSGKPGLRVENFEYTIAPAVKQGAEKTAWVRTWKIKGFAQASASSSLEKLNSEKGISELFQEFYASSGDVTAQTAELTTRNIEVIINQSANAQYQRDLDPKRQARDSTAAYPVTFDAVITQYFDNKDAMAMDIKRPLSSL